MYVVSKSTHVCTRYNRPHLPHPPYNTYDAVVVLTWDAGAALVRGANGIEPGLSSDRIPPTVGACCAECEPARVRPLPPGSNGGARPESIEPAMAAGGPRGVDDAEEELDEPCPGRNAAR